MTQRVVDGATAGVAAGSLTVPFWITQVSVIAQLVLPVLGATWLIVQIVYKVKEYGREAKRQEAERLGDGAVDHTDDSGSNSRSS